jgi:hypothetical protein
MENIVTKLRAEIQGSKKMRHEFVLRKFAFLTVLLGGGAMTNNFPSTLSVDLSWLLLLVPIVAIAFDFYILTEDYRIKRAGEFLRRKGKDVDEEEKEWESFSKQNPNLLSTAAFAFVTLIYLLGAGVILKQDSNSIIQGLFWWWVGAVVTVEILLMSISIGLRKWLEQSEKA